jgi:UDP-glucose 4-epimerase
MSKTFVVTGGNGYIGSHMCKLLHNAGHRVIVVDNHSTSPKKPVHSYGEFVDMDVSAGVKLTKLLFENNVDCVFHFAALALVGESQEKPLYYYKENFSKTMDLLSSCVDAKVRKFVFSSTCATFGVPETETISESNVQKPINTYGMTKLLIEMAMRDLAQKDMMDFVVFRYFNAAGCSSDSEIGENHEPETHLIPNIIKAHLAGETGTFRLLGDQYPTRDGSCIRDYIHVDDLAQAHFDGYRFIESNSGFNDFNLGSENGSSVKEVITAFEKISNSKLNVEVAPPRAGDPPSLVSNSAKAREVLNFKPKFSLEDSIEHTLNFFKANK